MSHNTTNTYSKPTEEEIAVRAFRIYESEGRPDGKATAHWLRAEAELISDLKSKQSVAALKTQEKGGKALEGNSRNAAGQPWQTALPRENLHHN